MDLSGPPRYGVEIHGVAGERAEGGSLRTPNVHRRSAIGLAPRVPRPGTFHYRHVGQGVGLGGGQGVGRGGGQGGGRVDLAQRYWRPRWSRPRLDGTSRIHRRRVYVAWRVRRLPECKRSHTGDDGMRRWRRRGPREAAEKGSSLRVGSIGRRCKTGRSDANRRSSGSRDCRSGVRRRSSRSNRRRRAPSSSVRQAKWVRRGRSEAGPKEAGPT